MGKKGHTVICSYLRVVLVIFTYAAISSDAQSADTSATIAIPQVVVSVDPPLYVLMEQSADDRVTLGWPLVQGISSYRAFRGVVVDHDFDSQGQLVEIDPPRLAWLPWARVDLVAGSATVNEDVFLVVQGGSASIDSSGVTLTLPTLNGIPTIWGVAAALTVGEEEYTSEIRRAYTTKVRVKGELLCWWDFDVNEDGRFNYDDYFRFADSFGTREVDYTWNPTYDFSTDGKVDMDDLYIFVDWWDLLHQVPKDYDQCGNPELMY